MLTKYYSQEGDGDISKLNISLVLMKKMKLYRYV